MWHDITISQPTDGAHVWIRRTTWWAHPVGATWDAPAQLFTIDDSALVIPWWAVSRWTPF